MTENGDLEGLKYSELQKLAKGAGIKANQKIEKLIKALKQHYSEAQTRIDTQNEQVKTKKSTPNPSDREEKSDSNKSKRKRRRTFELDEPTLSAANTPTTDNCSIQAKKPKSSERTKSKTNTPPATNSCNTKTNNGSARQQSSKSNTPITATSAEEESGPSRKRARRGTFDKDSPSVTQVDTTNIIQQLRKPTRSSKSNTPVLAETRPPSLPKKRIGTFDKNSPTAQDPLRGSPGTKAMVQSMDGAASNADMKASLLTALAKKVQEKVASGESSTQGNQPSQIPRFMAFLAQKKKDSQKTQSPGGKNWTKMHHKAFSKFDSIDVYLEKKQQRMDKLTNSGKKGIPSSPFGKGPAIAKPVTRPSAQVKPFVPTVVSTKNINFNFTKKTPTANTAKTPSKATATSGKKPSTAAKESAAKTPKSLSVSARKSVGSVKRETPFIFTGNTSSLNTTVHSQKKTFDLKASLAKPLTWKPHKGKLQALDTNKTGGAYVMKQSTIPKPVSSVVKTSRQAMANKSRPTHTNCNFVFTEM